MRTNGTAWILGLLLLVSAGATAGAGGFSKIESDSHTVVVREIIHPLAAQQITQNADPNSIDSGSSVACTDGGITTDNSWWRRFDLDGDHGLDGEFCIESVDWGTQTVIGSQELTINTYSLAEGLPFLLASLVPLDTVVVPVTDETLQFHNTPIGGCLDSESQELVVEFLSEDCVESGECLSLFIGTNVEGQSAPTYQTAPDCGLFEPMDVSWGESQLVLIVNGEGDGGNGGGEGGTTTGAVQEAKLVPADGSGDDYFGRSVALDGDTAVVGAYGHDDSGSNNGSAYVFTRAGGVWTEQAQLLPNDVAAGDWFGFSVDVEGDTAVIGAYHDDDNGNSSGSVYVFTRAAGIWTEQAKLIATDGEQGDQFGYSVALDGDTVVIGARNDDDNGDYSGSAYVFTRSGDTWSQQDKLLPLNAGTEGFVGDSVALDGDTAVLGTREPVAYVFTRSGGAWTEQASLVAPDVADSSLHPVALDGDTVVMGAHRNDDHGNDSGAAHVFARANGVWSHQAKLLPADGAPDDEFGRAVAVDGNTVLVGALFDDDQGNDSGSAYAFGRFGGVWIQQAKLLAADGLGHDEFGRGIAVAGDTLVVGAMRDDDHGSASGSAYVFRLVPGAGIPAVGGPGTVALAVLMMCAGAWFLHRKLIRRVLPKSRWPGAVSR